MRRPRWWPRSAGARRTSGPSWPSSAEERTLLDPGEYLKSLGSIGWKPGLGRMEVLCDALGRPQDRFESAHIVGTNGKTSVTRLATAMLAGEGRQAGCLTSPHFRHWEERVRTEGPGVSRPDFGAAIEKVAAACPEVEDALPDAGHPTQFEVSVAAGFLALAEAGVEVAVIEAGLGGRLDATNVLDSEVTALVSVGIDHTEWLGEDELAIATEKLAVLRPGTVLVTGPLSSEVSALAEERAESLGCRLLAVPAPDQGGFPALNLAIAAEVVGVLLEGPIAGETLEAARALSIPGRLQRVSTDPDVFYDVAHNRPGARALAEMLPSVSAGRPVVGCFGVASDKDAAGMLEELGPSLASLVVTAATGPVGSQPGRGGIDPAELAAMASDRGLVVEVAQEPVEAVELAGRRALAIGGVVLLFGSHSLYMALEPDA